MSKAGTHFDPLTDQEPNTSGTILDNRLAEERPLVVRHLEPPSSSPAIKRDRRSVPQTSETSTDTERDIVIVQRKGIKLTCPKRHIWIFTGRKDRGWTNCSKCKSSTKIPEQKKKTGAKQ